MQVKEVMSGSVELIDPNAMIRDAAIRMRDQDLGAIPVAENDRLIGMVTDRDIVVRAVAQDRGGGTTAVREVMAEKIYYCFEEDSLDAAGRAMADHKVRRLPVLNKDKRLVGMVALADLSRAGPEGAAAAEAALKEVTKPSPHQPRR
jgi:CBS domain-containing protein